LRNMTVLPHPVAPRQNDAFVAKALQVRNRNLAGCDKIAHESKASRGRLAVCGRRALAVAVDAARRACIHAIVARAPEQTVFTRFIPRSRAMRRLACGRRTTENGNPRPVR